jgi:hypothetical protein
MGFKRWLAEAQITDDAEGDLISDMKSDRSLPDFRDLKEMQAYLWGDMACYEAVNASGAIWRRYVKQKGEAAE